MAKKKKFRVGDRPGPDYKCSKCRGDWRRLWRPSHDDERLLCASCAEIDQADRILEYSKSHPPDEHRCTIGDLLPARPVPEGDTFWGHTSGDTEWWYRLQQYTDPERELALVRRERNHYLHQTEYYSKEWLEMSQRARQAERDKEEAMRFARLENIPK